MSGRVSVWSVVGLVSYSYDSSCLTLFRAGDCVSTVKSVNTFNNILQLPHQNQSQDPWKGSLFLKSFTGALTENVMQSSALLQFQQCQSK